MIFSEVAIGRVAKIVNGGTPTPDEDNWGGNIPWATPIDLGTSNGGEVSATIRTLTELGAKTGSSVVPENAVLLSTRAPIGYVAQARVPMAFNQGCKALVPNADLMSSFLLYALVHASAELQSLGQGSTFLELSGSSLSALKIPFPPMASQQQIAKYLDAHTEKIDLLIEKQERLIKTLAERLDGAWSSRVNELIARFPSVPMRRVIVSIVDGPFGSSLTSAHYSDEGAGVVRLGNIGVDEFKLDDRAYVPIEYAQSLSAHAVEPGDVVVAGLGDEKMPLGRAAIVPEAFGRGIVKADCYRVRPGRKVTPEYIAWILSSPQSRTQFRALSRGSTRQRLNTQVVQEVDIPLPTFEVQSAVVTAFASMRVSNDALIAKAREMIHVLKERRQTLISAAVTGMIDVRGLS